METNIPTASVTQEMIEEWKKKHGDVFKITVEDKTCFLKKPERKTLGYASSAKDPIKYNEIVLKGCWLAGDKEILTDDDLFFGVTKRLDELFNVKEAELEKL